MSLFSSCPTPPHLKGALDNSNGIDQAELLASPSAMPLSVPASPQLRPINANRKTEMQQEAVVAAIQQMSVLEIAAALGQAQSHALKDDPTVSGNTTCSQEQTQPPSEPSGRGAPSRAQVRNIRVTHRRHSSIDSSCLSLGSGVGFLSSSPSPPSQPQPDAKPTTLQRRASMYSVSSLQDPASESRDSSTLPALQHKIKNLNLIISHLTRESGEKSAHIRALESNLESEKQWRTANETLVANVRGNIAALEAQLKSTQAALSNERENNYILRLQVEETSRRLAQEISAAMQSDDVRSPTSAARQRQAAKDAENSLSAARTMITHLTESESVLRKQLEDVGRQLTQNAEGLERTRESNAALKSQLETEQQEGLSRLKQFHQLSDQFHSLRGQLLAEREAHETTKRQFSYVSGLLRITTEEKKAYRLLLKRLAVSVFVRTHRRKQLLVPIVKSLYRRGSEFVVTVEAHRHAHFGTGASGVDLEHNNVMNRIVAQSQAEQQQQQQQQVQTQQQQQQAADASAPTVHEDVMHILGSPINIKQLASPPPMASTSGTNAVNSTSSVSNSAGDENRIFVFGGAQQSKQKEEPQVAPSEAGAQLACIAPIPAALQVVEVAPSKKKQVSLSQTRTASVDSLLSSLNDVTPKLLAAQNTASELLCYWKRMSDAFFQRSIELKVEMLHQQEVEQQLKLEQIKQQQKAALELQQQQQHQHQLGGLTSPKRTPTVLSRRNSLSSLKPGVALSLSRSGSMTLTSPTHAESATTTASSSSSATSNTKLLAPLPLSRSGSMTLSSPSALHNDSSPASVSQRSERSPSLGPLKAPAPRMASIPSNASVPNSRDQSPDVVVSRVHEPSSAGAPSSTTSNQSVSRRRSLSSAAHPSLSPYLATLPGLTLQKRSSGSLSALLAGNSKLLGRRRGSLQPSDAQIDALLSLSPPQPPVSAGVPGISHQEPAFADLDLLHSAVDTQQ
jgi:hypothetical protein